MNYKVVIKNFKDIINSEFTIDDLNDLKGVYLGLDVVYNTTISNIYNNYSKEEKEIKVDEATREFKDNLDYVDEEVYTKLKDKLGFENEVIDTIMSLLKRNQNIEDIYVIDGVVILKESIKKKTKLVMQEENEFIEITSNNFASDYNDSVISLLIVSLNDLLKKYIFPNEEFDLLKIDNKKIMYAIPDLNIYVNRSIDDIVITENGTKVTKLIVTYNDQIFYFDMKINNCHITLSQNEFKVNVISDMLTPKGKQLEKK